MIPDPASVCFRLKEAEVNGISDSYGQKQTGELVVVVDSEEFIELAVVNGNAAHTLNAKVGDAVEVIFRVQ